MSNLHEIDAALKSNDFPKTDWYQFGFNLGLKKTTLDEIESRCNGNLYRCLMECLSHWLKEVDYVDKKGGTTWNTLANALEEIGEKRVACNIRKKGNLFCFHLCMHTKVKAVYISFTVDYCARLLHRQFFL